MIPNQPPSSGAARAADSAPNRASAGDGERAYRQLWEDMQTLGRVGYWVADLRTGLTEWSPETRRILGVSADSPAGQMEFGSTVHPDDRDAAARAVDNALAERREAFEHECRRTAVGTGLRASSAPSSTSAIAAAPRRRSPRASGGIGS